MEEGPGSLEGYAEKGRPAPAWGTNAREGNTQPTHPDQAEGDCAVQPRPEPRGQAGPLALAGFEEGTEFEARKRKRSLEKTPGWRAGSRQSGQLGEEVGGQARWARRGSVPAAKGHETTHQTDGCRGRWMEWLGQGQALL